MTLCDIDRWRHIYVVALRSWTRRRFTPPQQRSYSAVKTEILSVGRLVRGKGLSLLLASVAELVDEGLDLSVTVVGEGPARQELETDVRRLQLHRRVRFEGAAGQDEIRSFYERADIFCLPSFAEGIPVVAMEAMATELPVLTTQIMGVPELVENGVDGMLVPPGRIDSLSDSLRSLVRAPELRRTIGAAARRKICERYDVRASAAEMRSVLEREIGLQAEA